MPQFMLTHRHLPAECRVAFAAWRGFESPLRHGAALSTCAVFDGGTRREPGTDAHSIWWTVEAESDDAALALLPAYVAERTEVREVGEVPIP